MNNHRHVLRCEELHLKEVEVRRGRWMKGRFAMDGSDRMSFDRNDTSLNRRWISIVWLRLIGGPSASINLSRYNECDRRLGFIHLSEY